MYMATTSSLFQSFSGIKSLSNVAGYPKMPLQFQKSDTIRFSKSHHGTALALGRTQLLEKLSFHGRSATVPISHAGRNELSYNDDYHTEPFWLSTIQAGICIELPILPLLPAQKLAVDMVSSTQLLLVFCYFPFEIFAIFLKVLLLLKTAMLTLVLVALLIVALSSVDSALSYLLALVLRRKT